MRDSNFIYELTYRVEIPIFENSNISMTVGRYDKNSFHAIC